MSPGADSRRLPSLHHLRAALSAGRLIDEDGTNVKSLRTSFGGHASGGIFRVSDLEAGEALLYRAGVIQQTDGLITPTPDLAEILRLPDVEARQSLLGRLIECTVPLWLLAATSGDRLTDALIPDHDAEVLEALFDPEAREAFLLALGRRFSDLDLEAIGDRAEEFLAEQFAGQLIALGRPDLAEKVERLSLVSDQLGYDIRAPKIEGESRRIEAKGTRGTSESVTFFLSRNEAEASRGDDDWSLVACRIDGEDANVIGWMTGEQLEPFLPLDQTSDSRWEKVRITVPESAFNLGLPAA
jgi:hypothetical protein